MNNHLIITPDFEKFDSLHFERIRGTGIFDGFEFLENGTLISMTSVKAGKSYTETPNNSYFFIKKTYYPNGNIEAKGLAFTYGRFDKGIWYYFDEHGNLTKTVDLDEPFTFTFEDVLKFAEKEGIMFYKTPVDWDSYHPQKPQIYRAYKPEENLCIWQIYWFNREISKLELITLNGKTGKEISRKYMELGM